MKNCYLKTFLSNSDVEVSDGALVTRTSKIETTRKLVNPNQVGKKFRIFSQKILVGVDYEKPQKSIIGY